MEYSNKERVMCYETLNEYRFLLVMLVRDKLIWKGVKEMKRVNFKRVSAYVLVLCIISTISFVGPVDKIFGSSTNMVDQLELGIGKTSSETSHSLQGSGNTAQTETTVKTGTVTETEHCRYVYNNGSWFTANLSLIQNQPLTIQKREVRPDALRGYTYSYDVYLDDGYGNINKLVYRKNTTDKGGGPYSSIFIDEDDPRIISAGRNYVTIKIVSTSSNAAYISDIFAYSNLYGTTSAGFIGERNL